MNNCTKYGFNNLIISGSYGGHRRHTTDDGLQTTPWVWHKFPTGELKIVKKWISCYRKITFWLFYLHNFDFFSDFAEHGVVTR